MVIRMLLKELLIQYEVKNDKSHVEVAKEVGVSLSTYYRWLNGESLHLKNARLIVYRKFCTMISIKW